MLLQSHHLPVTLFLLGLGEFGLISVNYDYVIPKLPTGKSTLGQKY